MDNAAGWTIPRNPEKLLRKPRAEFKLTKLKWGK